MGRVLTATSVVGQWLLGRKYVENWPTWIVVDVVGAALFAYKGLWLTTILISSSSRWSTGWRSWPLGRGAGARGMSAPAFVVALLGRSTGKTTPAGAIGAAPRRGLRVEVVGEVLREFCDACARRGATSRRRRRGADRAHRRRRADVVVADTTAPMIAVYSDLVFSDTSLYASALRRSAGST